MAETELMRIVTPNATSDSSPRHWFQHSGDKVSPIMIPMQKTARDFLPSDSDENIEMETRSNCHCGPDCQSECRGFSLEAETTTTLLPESTEEEDSVSMSLFDSDDDAALVREKNDKEDVIPNGGPVIIFPTCRSPVEEPHCDCHVKVTDNTTRKAKIRLITACLIALIFMIGEVIGGYLAGSLAIMTDAAHMLSDFIGYLISLFAIWVASRPPSKHMTFGWHRAEVIGAMVSVLIIWVLTGVLVYEAVLRVIHQTFEVDANIMLITACVGVFVNVLMCSVLDHAQSQGSGSGPKTSKKDQERKNEEGDKEMEDLVAMESNDDKKKKKAKRKKEQNINVRAAFIHAIGDLFQSVGVVIAGYIIWFKPEWKIADPICTFLFSVLVLISTFNILKDALRVLMEAAPKNINYETVKEDLGKIDGVKQAHSLHIWSLTLNKIALAAHLVLEPGANNQQVLTQASHMLKEKYDIHQTTLQVEDFHPTMDECRTCQKEMKSRSKLLPCWP